MYSAVLKAARPQVVAALSRYFEDLDVGEDLFQDACLRALQVWPTQGLPCDATAWLIRVGRNAGIDAGRKYNRFIALEHTAEPSDQNLTSEQMTENLDQFDYRDDILRLLFTCCHPVLSKTQQIILALKIIAGLSVAEIGRAFLVQTKTMEQRITRAKKRIAALGVSYAAPSRDERITRIRAVNTTLYLLFNEGYSASGGDAHIREPLCDEAIRLCRILLQICPAHCETMGLLSLCLLQHSRRAARLDARGYIVLLEDQNRTLWDGDLINEGKALLEKALRKKQPGSFQLQAAIAAVHAQDLDAKDTNWAEIERLYRILESLNQSPLVTLNRAVAVVKLAGPLEALTLVDTLAQKLPNYMHFHGLRAALLSQLGHSIQAGQAFEQAMKLAKTPAERAHLSEQMKKNEK